MEQLSVEGEEEENGLAFILLPNTVKVKCILGGINQEGMSSMPSQGTTRKSAVLHFSGL